MRVRGKLVKETLTFRVLGHRDDFDLSGRASLKHAKCIVESKMSALRWTRKSTGSDYAFEYAASRIAPSALYAVEAGARPTGYNALGNRVARAALGLEPYEEQNLPPSWHVLASHKWVT